MGVFTFIAKQDGGAWSAKAYSKEDGHDDSMTAEGATVFELERALVKLAQSKSSGGGVQLSFNQITPKSAVVVVSIGATAVAAAAPASGGAAAAAGGAAAAPAKKEEPSEEDEDMGFSLFD